VKEYKPNTLPTFRDNKEKRKLKVVLDGQQRLQSLYIGLNGSYNNKYLYFDVLSGFDSDDFKEEKFLFFFKTDNEALKENRETLDSIEDYIAKGKTDFDEEILYLIKVQDILSWGPLEKNKFLEDVGKTQTI